MFFQMSRSALGRLLTIKLRFDLMQFVDQVDRVTVIAALMMFFISCSHNNANVDGQIFVVLENRESVKLSLTEVYSVSRETAVDIVNEITSQRNLELRKIREQEHNIAVSHDWIELGFQQFGLPGDELATQAKAKIERVRNEFNKREEEALNLPKIAQSVKFRAAARATTDVDGKFSMPRVDRSACLFAATTRQTGVKTEYFCWLVRPTDLAHVMLTNKNTIQM